MRDELRRILIATFLMTLAFPAPALLADTEQSREYQLKAAFLYNFIKFADWPAERIPDTNEPIILGIVGKDPFAKAFEPIKEKLVKGKKVAVKRFKPFQQLKDAAGDDKDKMQEHIDAIRKCHVLFVCSSEKRSLKEILTLVKNHPVLTVGETQGFLETGGICNFLMEQNKVRFEVSVAAAKKAKLKMRSQLLRLAKKVVE